MKELRRHVNMLELIVTTLMFTSFMGFNMRQLFLRGS